MVRLGAHASVHGNELRQKICNADQGATHIMRAFWRPLFIGKLGVRNDGWDDSWEGHLTYHLGVLARRLKVGLLVVDAHVEEHINIWSERSFGASYFRLSHRI